MNPEDLIMKKCTGCGEPFSLSTFHMTKRVVKTKDGKEIVYRYKRSDCPKCRREKRAAKREEKKQLSLKGVL